MFGEELEQQLSWNVSEPLPRINIIFLNKLFMHIRAEKDLTFRNTLLIAFPLS